MQIIAKIGNKILIKPALRKELTAAVDDGTVTKSSMT